MCICSKMVKKDSTIPADTLKIQNAKRDKREAI
jgi:hypothetical protein